MTLGELAQKRTRLVDHDLVARQCSGAITRVESIVSELSTRPVGRLRVMRNPEAEQRSAGALADIGGLGEQARTDLGARAAHPQKASDLYGSGTRAQAASAQRRIHNVD